MFDQVFREELEEIRKRRAAVGLSGPPDSMAPSVDVGLAGLALSGGGIRSAAFGLGVLQALSDRGVLPHMDYVSTVSGGGLIGATMTSTLQVPDSSMAPDRFPLGFSPGVPERPAVRYLRQHSRYLAEGGFLDTVRLPAIFLRGMLDNAALLLPGLMLLVVVTEVAFGLAYNWGTDRLRLIPFGMMALFALVVVLQPVVYRLFSGGGTWSQRNRYELVLSALLVAVIAVLVAIPVFLLQQRAIDISWDVFSAWVRSHTVAMSSMGAGTIAAIGGAVVMSQRPGLPGRLGLLALGLSAHVAVLAVFLLMTLYQVDSPVLDRSLQTDLASGRVTARLVEAFAARDVALREGDAIEQGIAGDGPRDLRWDIQGEIVVLARDGTLRLVNVLFDGARDWYFLGIGLLALAYGVIFFNPNVTSPHQFFRDRMSHSFLFQIGRDERVEPADNLKLSTLSGQASGAPYHLFNTTLNLQGADDTHELGGRVADFFVLASRHCGSVTTGYCATTELEKYDPHLSVATAIAISGGGLAPNGGTQTIKPLVYLTTLLNLRLDYWLPNPTYVGGAWARRMRLHASVGPSYLLKEAFGLLDAKGPYVNLSDGGHIENLGVYELLRRRCRWIVAVDASEDQAMRLTCLMDLIRYARIDFGIKIDVKVAALAPDARGFVTSHWVVATIDYGQGDKGQLVYVKASVTGDEPAPILEYRSRNPTFPQESSSNQFFTESQFEAYRALGEHITNDWLNSAGDFPGAALATLAPEQVPLSGAVVPL